MNAGRPRAVKGLWLAFYGDDFTGSTDALESLTRAGLRTRLFTAPPTRAQLARAGRLDAVGVAGVSRSLAPTAMTRELRAAFLALRRLGPRHVHYKVCSTFDSSPGRGSIGRAIDVGAAIFPHRFVPVVVGAPGLGRYCVFGTLFARWGTAGAGAIHRLDRHPVMSRHPVTPMDEADLGRHLARQTRRPIVGLNWLQLEGSLAEGRAALARMSAEGAKVVLFDSFRPDHLRRIGELLAAHAHPGRPLFSVGSSAVGTALSFTRVERAAPRFAVPGAAVPLVVVSGSCSAVTGGQIDWAVAQGFAGFRLATTGRNCAPVRRAAAAALRAGQHVIIYTSHGAADAGPVSARRLGGMLGGLARDLMPVSGRRLVIAGGDTSGYVARALGIEALEMIAPLVPGAPLCRAMAADPAIDGLEINFKGGQVGAVDYFGAVARGHL